MKQISALLIGLGILPAGTLCAQQQAADSTLNRTVVVENQYNPEVMDAFKVNVLPKVEEPQIAKQHIDYATSVRPLSVWTFTPMEAITPTLSQEEAPRGYARLAYGNRNNMDARLSYLWDISSKDRLQMMGSFYGRDGKVPSYCEEEADWSSRFFRTDLNLDYRHSFRKVSLSLGGAFGSQVFNYMPNRTADGENDRTTTGRQRYTEGEGYVGVSSVEGQLPVEFAFQTGFRSFSLGHDIPYLESGAERTVHTQGFVAGSISEEQQVGIGFAMDNLMYDAGGLKDYTLLQVNPYYTWANDALRLRLGMHVDWQSANGSGVKLAPDVRLDYTFADSYTLYLHALGGTSLNDFRSINHITPYALCPMQLRSAYTPVDAQAGLKASPLAGLGFRLFGGYRITKNEVGVLPAAVYSNQVPYYYALLGQDKASVAYAGAALDYGYKDRFDFSLQGTYQHWDVDGESDNLLYLKPQFVLEASARAKIWRELYAAVSYRYEGRTEVTGLEKADAVNDLSLWAGYEFARRVNVFVRFNNVLNRNYIAENGYPVQGFYAMGGVSVRF